MRVLVTGAAGFVGRAVLSALARRPDHEVHGLDRRPVHGATPHLGDLLDASATLQFVKGLAPHRIFQLAGSFSNEFTAEFADNVVATRNLLEAVRLATPRTRVLLVGSAAEYGWVRPEANPVREDHPLHPVSIYGWAKACQTQLMGYYCRVQELDLVMARVFNLTGPGVSNRLFVGRVEEQIERLCRGQTGEIVVGNLEAVRDYLPVDEAAAKLARIMERGATGEVYNVGSGQPITMRALLDKLLTQHGLGWEHVRIESRDQAGKLDVPCIYADTSKLDALN
jgi:GDP-4-dehydro-6-deoxy-D-mannose reductase